MPNNNIIAAPYPISAPVESKKQMNAVPWLLWLSLPLALFPLLIWLELKADIAISALFYDAQSASFPWREHALTSAIHQFGRLPAALIFLGFALASVLHQRHRRMIEFVQTRFVCLSMLVCLIVVNLIKRSANSACSWDLVEFGGHYPHLNWFASLPFAMPPGHCWPGAFSLSGFGLIAVYFYLYARASYRRATLVLALIVLYANALGFVQVMRGAHGLSHQLWTGLICWYLSLLCYWLYTRRA